MPFQPCKGERASSRLKGRLVWFHCYSFPWIGREATERVWYVGRAVKPLSMSKCSSAFIVKGGRSQRDIPGFCFSTGQHGCDGWDDLYSQLRLLGHPDISLWSSSRWGGNKVNLGMLLYCLETSCIQSALWVFYFFYLKTEIMVSFFQLHVIYKKIKNGSYNSTKGKQLVCMLPSTSVLDRPCPAN